MDKLKPCPFCGGEAEMLNFSPKDWLVICPVCYGMVERWVETKEEAITQWNMRALDERWISVDDRLPADYETVMVYKPLAKGTTIEIQITQGWCVNPLIMSHWMPLPKPPKEKDDE